MPEEPSALSGAPRAESLETHRLRQAASEMVLSASNLTDELTDDEAEPLIHWAVRQADAAVSELAQAGLDSGASPRREPDEILADRLNPVRKMMKRINRLVASRHDLPMEEFREELVHLFLLAKELPRPPRGTVLPAQVAELGSQQANLENGVFVQVVIGLLEGSPWRDVAARTLPLDQGD